MKIAFITVSVLIALSIAFLFILGKYSQKGQAPGLVNGSLSRCSEKPNCVCSEYRDDVDHYTEAVTGIENSESLDMSRIMSTIVTTIQGMNGVIRSAKDNYVAATFTSSVFGFVDDFEVRIDSNQSAMQGTMPSTMHFRSASRVGYSDGGVNKKRVELFKKLYSEAM